MCNHLYVPYGKEYKTAGCKYPHVNALEVYMVGAGSRFVTIATRLQNMQWECFKIPIDGNPWTTYRSVRNANVVANFVACKPLHAGMKFVMHRHVYKYGHAVVPFVPYPEVALVPHSKRILQAIEVLKKALLEHGIIMSSMGLNDICYDTKLDICYITGFSGARLVKYHARTSSMVT